jgi:hypothetical protein
LCVGVDILYAFSFFGNLILPHPATRDDFFGYGASCAYLRSFDFDPLFPSLGRLSPDPDLTSDRGGGGLVFVERKENALNKTEHTQDR